MKSAPMIDFDTFQAKTCLAFPILLCAAFLCTSATAQTYRVIHFFSGGADGAIPQAGLTLDRAGNLYGTTATGSTPATCQCGNVFKLTNHDGNWTLTPLYQFRGGDDGAVPAARVLFGPDGRLYGTTSGDGPDSAAGTVFALSPSPSPCKSVFCYWQKTLLHTFRLGTGDAAYPNLGDLTFDSAGNVYGATTSGGAGNCTEHGCGAVYEMTRAGGSWAETVLYSFQTDTGNTPYAGITFDSHGTAFGTNANGGLSSYGSVYQLIPGGGTWTGMDIVNFPDRAGGRNPMAGLAFDSVGNVFGATSQGPTAATVFELTPSGSGWTYQVIYGFPRAQGPYANLTIDTAGNLYGTSLTGGVYGYGSVFKLTHAAGGWTYAVLHDFQGGTDGAQPISNVTIDSAGNLYGTTQIGGHTTDLCQAGCGVAWEITP